MARFYFDIQTSDGLFRDNEGEDLADAEAARGEAVLVAEELPRRRSGRTAVSPTVTVTVRDRWQRQVCQAVARVTVH